jgi:hypothetical protein
MGVAKELVASINTCRSRRARVRVKVATNERDEKSFQESCLISGLSYKTAFSNELLTSIFPL